MDLVQNLTTKQVAQMVGLHLKTFEKYLREGKMEDFPTPCRQVNGRRCWLSDEVENWIRNRPRATDKKAA